MITLQSYSGFEDLRAIAQTVDPDDTVLIGGLELTTTDPTAAVRAGDVRYVIAGGQIARVVNDHNRNISDARVPYVIEESELKEQLG